MDDCTPEARITKSLLGYGVLAGPCYVLGSVIHGLLRDDFDVSRDSWSLLSVGPHGWVHVVVFVITGLMVIAAGVGVRRHTHDLAGPALVAYGVLLVLAGVAIPDAPGGSLTTSGLVHLAAGGLGFLAFCVTAIVSGRRFRRQGSRGWAAWSVGAGVLLLLGFVGVASGSTNPAAILGFTVAVVLSWAWLTTASLKWYQQAAAAGRIPAVSSTVPG